MTTHKLDCFVENENYETASVFCTCDWSFQAKWFDGNSRERLTRCAKEIRKHIRREAGVK